MVDKKKGAQISVLFLIIGVCCQLIITFVAVVASDFLVALISLPVTVLLMFPILNLKGIAHEQSEELDYTYKLLRKFLMRNEVDAALAHLAKEFYIAAELEGRHAANRARENHTPRLLRDKQRAELLAHKEAFWRFHGIVKKLGFTVSPFFKDYLSLGMESGKVE